jgi:hypothetical protein
MLEELKYIIDDSPERFKKKRRDTIGFSPFYKLAQNMYKDVFACGVKIFFWNNFLGEEVGDSYCPQTGNSCTGKLLQAVGQLSVQS